jgi:ABC-type dipeptide/oligopeptide/nickel transport system permease subunit
LETVAARIIMSTVFGATVLTEAGLSFPRLGVGPPAASWGWS